MNYNIQVDEDGFDIIPGSPKNIIKADTTEKEEYTGVLGVLRGFAKIKFTYIAIDAVIMAVLFIVVFNLFHFWCVMNRPWTEHVSEELYNVLTFKIASVWWTIFWGLINYGVFGIYKLSIMSKPNKLTGIYILLIISDLLIVLFFGILSGFLWSMNSEIYFHMFYWPCTISVCGALWLICHLCGTDR